MAAPGGGGWEWECVFDVSMNQKLLQELSPANLKDILLDATGFMDSDLRS